jgi:MFS family permease
MSVVAVAWLAIDLAPAGQAGVLLGAAVAAYTLPGALGAVLFARRLRRLPPGRLLAADATLRAVALGCVPLAWATGLLGPVGYVLLLAAASLLHAWGGAGKYALVARLLPAAEHQAANALLGSSAALAMLLGPAVAGLLVGSVGPAWLIGVDALTFAVLAGGARAVASVDGGPAVPERPGAGGTVRLLRRTPQLAGVLALTWLFNALYGPVEVALPLHVTGDLHAGAGLLGLYWALFGAGAVLGGLTAGGLRRLPIWPAALVVVAGWGTTLVCVARADTAPVSMAWFALGGLLYGPFGPLTMTMHQRLVPPHRLASVLALRRAVLLTAAPVGTALGGPLTAVLGPRQVLADSGAATLALAVAGGAVLALAARRGR